MFLLCVCIRKTQIIFKRKLKSNVPVLIPYIKATLYTGHCPFLGLFAKHSLWKRGSLAFLSVIWYKVSLIIPCFCVYLHYPALFEDLYAFFYNPKSTNEMRENGWKLIDPVSDFGRMGIPNRYWTITDANRNYEVILSLSFSFRSI